MLSATKLIPFVNEDSKDKLQKNAQTIEDNNVPPRTYIEHLNEEVEHETGSSENAPECGESTKSVQAN